jgi:phenylalanyl-tRNA synthetase beta chain
MSEIKHNVESVLHTTKLHDIKLGTLGILHPSVLEKFEIGYPCSAVEFTLEPFKKQVHAIWTNDL